FCVSVIESQAGPSRGTAGSARHRTAWHGMAGHSGAGSVADMDRLKVLCFAGTYGLALVCELARLVVRSSFRWYLTVGLTSLGWLVQTVYLANLALKDQIILPVTSAFESVMVLAWIVAFIGLFLMLHWPRQVAVGIFVLPLVLGLVVVAGWFVPRESDWLEEGMMAFWGTVHGIFLLGGAVCACVAFAAGLMYLAQMRRLKSKRPARLGLALPSLGPETGFTLSWSDPKVVSALGMWLVFAALLHARFRPALRGRSVMVLTIVAFAFLVFTWVGIEALKLPTAHGAARTAGGHP